MNREEIIEKYKLVIDPNIIIEDNEDFITCRLCGFKSKKLYGAHFQYIHNDIRANEYRILFPNAPIKTDIFKNSYGEHRQHYMQTDKYRKMMSEKWSGSNNPMHKSNTTEEARKSNSPFSIEFYNRLYPELSPLKRQKLLKEAHQNAADNRISNTELQYYLNKGLSQEDAEAALKERQAVGRLDKFIARYGEDEGTRRWENRQIKWMNSYKKNNFSKVSQELFTELYPLVKHLFCEIYFAVLDDNGNYDYSGKNYEYRLKLNTIGIMPDFFVKDVKKIIEFDGSYYHNRTEGHVKREEKRDREIIESGYQVYHVKEEDFKNARGLTIRRCIEFLKS